MKLKSIAVLITCFNRKEKTLNCIECLNNQVNIEHVKLKIFVIDGGSNDGTVEAIHKTYPQVTIEIGEGLYWAGGMRLAWETAIKEKLFNYYLLINDDTVVFSDTVFELLKADRYSLKEKNTSGVYIGSTYDSITKKHSYGGKKLKSWGNLSAVDIIPNGANYKICDLGNANIMMVSSKAYDVLGILCKRYTHSIADYDYTLSAVKNEIPVWVLPNYQGECTNDNGENFLTNKSSIKQRISHLYSPKGNSYHEYMYFIKKFFPNYQFVAFLKLWGRVFIPSLWTKFKK